MQRRDAATLLVEERAQQRREQCGDLARLRRGRPRSPRTQQPLQGRGMAGGAGQQWRKVGGTAGDVWRKLSTGEVPQHLAERARGLSTPGGHFQVQLHPCM
jgi:hypothetical protein